MMFVSFTSLLCLLSFSFFFFFNDTATTEIYTLSLHDALPIFSPNIENLQALASRSESCRPRLPADRKSTRLNSSHLGISYAVFCLKKKKIILKIHTSDYPILNYLITQNGSAKSTYRRARERSH